MINVLDDLQSTDRNKWKFKHTPLLFIQNEFCIYPSVITFINLTYNRYNLDSSLRCCPGFITYQLVYKNRCVPMGALNSSRQFGHKDTLCMDNCLVSPNVWKSIHVFDTENFILIAKYLFFV